MSDAREVIVAAIQEARIVTAPDGGRSICVLPPEETADAILSALTEAGIDCVKLEQVGWHNPVHPGKFVARARRPPDPWEPVYRIVSGAPKETEG